MKREIIMWGVIVALVVGALLLSAPKERPMAIDFIDGSSMDFGVVPAVNSSTAFTFHTSVILTGANPVGFPHIIMDIDDGSLSTGDIEIKIYNDATYNYLSFLVEWDKGPSPVSRGLWNTSEMSFSNNVEYTIDITYDMGSASNNPIVYINGSPVSVSEITSPAAPPPNIAADNLWIGGLSGLSGYSGEIVRDFRIYNRILTAAEIATIYSARGRDNIRNGLVFCPYLIGAKGLQAFDGATLAAENTIVDPCSGAVGVPTGNPVGVGETFLSLK